MDLGSVAVFALVAGLAGGAVGAALVGTVEGMLRQRQMARGSVTYPNQAVFRSTRTYRAVERPHGDAPFTDFNDLAKRVLAFAQDEAIMRTSAPSTCYSACRAKPTVSPPSLSNPSA